MSAHERARQLHDMAEQLREEAEARGGLDELAEKQIDGLQRWAKHFGRNAAEAEIERVGRALGAGPAAGDGRFSDAPVASAYHQDFGRAFVESEGYKSCFGPGAQRGQSWSTGLVEIAPGPQFGAYEMKGTLMEAPGFGGAPFAATPQVIPGVVPKLFQMTTVAQAFSAGIATGASIRTIVEGTATSGAAGVLEGAAKPESQLGFTYVDEPVRKIATVLPISEEMLEDAPAIQPLINNSLVTFVRIEEERQLLRGTAGGAEVQGLLTGRGVPVYAGGTAAGNKAEQIFRAMNGVRGSAFVEPDWTIISPSDYEQIRLLKDNSGQLYGGGPFLGAYGVGSPVAASGQATGAVDYLWGKPCFVTSSIGPGTAVVGSTACAAVWRRGGLRVEATNSHGNNFVLNLIAIRAEERLGLTVYRPGGFCEVRLA